MIRKTRNPTIVRQNNLSSYMLMAQTWPLCFKHERLPMMYVCLETASCLVLWNRGWRLQLSPCWELHLERAGQTWLEMSRSEEQLKWSGLGRWDGDRFDTCWGEKINISKKNVGDGFTRKEGKRKTSEEICRCVKEDKEIAGVKQEEVGDRVRCRKMICCGDPWG